MADLVSHLCVALLPGAASRSPRVALVGVGTVVPDLFGRAVPLALEQVQAAGAPIPDPALWLWGALHEPAGYTLVAGLCALAVVRRDRRAAFGALWLGCALHTALDLTQFHHGHGYLVLAPLSSATFELGWIGSEATVDAAPWLALATAIAWLPALWEARFGVPRPDLRAVAAVALPLHAGLSLVVASAWGAAGPAAVGWGVAWLHLVGLGLLLGTRRWWEGRWPAVVGLIVADHLVTLGLLAWLAG